MYPSHAEIRIGPINWPEIGADKRMQLQGCCDEWAQFREVTQDRYGLSLEALDEPYRREAQTHFLETANEYHQILPEHLSGPERGALVFEMDCHTCSAAEASGVDSPFEVLLDTKDVIQGLARHPHLIPLPPPVAARP